MATLNLTTAAAAPHAESWPRWTDADVGMLGPEPAPEPEPYEPSPEDRAEVASWSDEADDSFELNPPVTEAEDLDARAEEAAALDRLTAGLDASDPTPSRR